MSHARRPATPGAALAFTFTLALGGVARASGGYPAVLQDELRLARTPDCAVCHAGAPTSGTATTALSNALKSRGMTGGNNEAALRFAVQALVAEKSPEIAHLAGGGAVEGPEYGCSVTEHGARGSAAIVALALLASLLRARRGHR